ncbi:DUF3040 domain-containing protein [Streptomyces sp. Qhu_M48]|uniref:DUF3040 domain-containing protein n=1 Tax=Streptomyces sp. Qhu_M48 TaxID=3435889 RepID=UPI003F503987
MLTITERDLARDRRLDRRLRTMRCGMLLGARRHWLMTMTLMLAMASTVLMVRAVQSSSSALIWAFAAAWCGTLGGAACLVRRWCVKEGRRFGHSPGGLT